MALNANISVENFVAKAKLLASLHLFAPYDVRIVNVPQEHRSHFYQSGGTVTVNHVSFPLHLTCGSQHWLLRYMFPACSLPLTCTDLWLLWRVPPPPPSLPTFQLVSSQCHRANLPTPVLCTLAPTWWPLPPASHRPVWQGDDAVSPPFSVPGVYLHTIY